MSKKFYFIFSILVFAILFSFIGCTDLLNPKTQTDINLNIDLSKIIKSARSSGDSQSSISLGENPVIKVAIYDAKNFDATSNSTENLTLITQAQASIGGDGIARVKLNDIPIGIDAIVFAELSFSNGTSTEVVYAGNSDVFRVKPTDNKVSLVLMKVANSETSPDNTNTEEIINAKEPIITTQPESHIKIYSSETGENFTYVLKITAESSDNGKISYKWQKLDNENWVDIENSSSEEIEVTVSKNTSCVYRCVVTNTNENVNGEKTASIYSNEVTVAYVEGSLTSITAEYTGSYELFGKDFTYSKVSVTETYTSSDDATNPKPITFIADKSRYSISPTDSEDAIGYVPYTVTRNDSTLTEAIITVPVKYELDASNLVLETCFNSICVSESDTDNAIKIPQYGTVKYVYQISDNTVPPSKLIEQNNEHTEIKDINNTGYYTATIVDEKNQDIPNGSICAFDGSYKYTVTLQSANEWFICNSNTSKDFSVKVCPWEIILTPSESTSTVDINNISVGSYILSISNDACTSQNLPPATFSCLVNDINIITYDQLEIDNNFTKGTITATVGNIEVASLEISRVTFAAGLTCVVDSDYTVTLYISNAEGLITFRNIVNGSFDSNIIVRYQENANSTHTFSARVPSQNVNAVLEKDITISGEWTPIGVYSNTITSARSYLGTFDGGGKTVTFNNITHRDTSMYSSGLFQMVSGTVKNLVIDGFISRTATGYIGGVVGYLDGGTIENCVNKATITNSASNGTGGIVGYVASNTATIKNCVNMAKVESKQSTVGGIVGNVGNMSVNSNLTISKCINLGKISGASNIFGILGTANTSAISISDCMNLGEISANNTSGPAYASGITTPSAAYTVSYCINVGQVSATSETLQKSGAISSIPTNGTYTNNYYDSTVNSSVVDSSTPDITRKSTTELIGSNLSLEGISDGQWTFADNRYPLPDIAENIPDDENDEIWNAVLEAATPEVSSSGGTTSTYSVGDVYPKDGTPIGVVFKTDTEYVYIVGLDEGNFTYGTQNCVNQIENASNVTFNNSSDGCQNMTNWYDFITTNSADFSSAEFPAFNYCLTYRDTEGEAGTWYLPASQELSIIKSNIEILNNTLQSQNATQIGTNSQYWSSTYVSEGKANVVGMLSDSPSQNTISTEYYVRPCKRINITDGSSDVLIIGLNVDTACTAISKIYTKGEHYIKLDSNVIADDLEKDIYIKLNENLSKNKLLDSDGNPTAFVYLDLSSTQITELPAETFWRLKNLSGVILPSTIQTIDASSFQGCINLTKFVVPADNPYFTVDESKPAILLSKDKSKLISYPSASEGYTIPENITSLAEYAFGDATNLKSVTIHANLTDIPSNAFYGAWSLETFTVDTSNSKYTTDDSGEILLSKDKTELISWPYAFLDVSIPNSVTKIADYALAETGITSVVLNNVEEIGDYAFYCCLGYDRTYFETLTIPSYVTKIGKYAFYGCENLEKVEFADSINWTVKNDEGLTESVTVTNFNVNNLIYASDDEAAKGYADYTWIKDSSSTSGGGIANYTDTDGISISNYQYPKTSLVTVNSENVTVNCSDEANGVFYFYENVTISPFAMGQYEVTQELYQAVMTKNPTGFKEDTLASGETQNLRPVDSVNWYQAVAFCNELTIQTMGKPYCVYYTDSSCSTVYTTNDAYNETLPYFYQSKKGYRLPTQVEWEFAARGGDEFQECWSYPYPGLSEDTNDSLLTIAWFESNANSVSHEVGLKTPNTLSLYDMAGNLMEWCWDYYLEDFYIGNGNNPTGPDSGEERILCGGYFDDFSYSCYSYSSTSYSPIPNENWINTVGFRICRSL